MRQMAGWLLAAVACIVLGMSLRQVADWEMRAVDADRELATLQYANAAEDFAALADDAAGRPAQWAWADRLAHAQNGKATADYWQATADATPALADRVLRAALLAPDRTAALAGLDNAVRLYAAILKKADREDVAYNYEFAARARATLTLAKNARTAFSLPAPPDTSVHGRAGSPPPTLDMKVFKMFVPMRPDERKTQQPDAGKGQKKERKG